MTFFYQFKIQLWDTAGLERAGRMTSNYYNYSHAVLLMYDVTDLSSLGGLQMWYDNAVRDSNNNSNTLYFLVGNKIDETPGSIEVSENRAVSYAADVIKLPTENTISFRISAKTGEGLNNLLEEVARILSGSKHQQKPDNDNIIIDRIDGGKKKGCC